MRRKRTPSDEALYADYVRECKAARIKPGTFEAVFGNRDPDRPRPPAVFKSTHQKNKETKMAKATIIPVSDIAAEFGITEEEVLEFIKAIDSYPSQMTRKKVDELAEIVAAKNEKENENEFSADINQPEIASETEPFSIEELPDDAPEGECLGGFEYAPDAEPIDISPAGTTFADAGMENRFILTKGTLLEIIAEAKREAKEEALRSIVMPAEITAADVIMAERSA